MRIAVLVSGGVDSSVALKLLKDEGHDIAAFYLKIWLEDEAAFLGECPWEEDLRYARAVCEQLGVPLEVVPLQREYRDRVIAYAIAETREGHTPNPDVMCNGFIKFGAFLDWLDAREVRSTAQDRFDKVATGHYARVVSKKRPVSEGNEETEEYTLLTARDPVKDQTYFLSRLTQRQLFRARFPIGDFMKSEVRAMAKKWDLPTQTRPDSQGLCFLGKIDYRDFVRRYLGEQEGNIVNVENGEVVAKHQGHWFYTIGQRHGLDLSGGPWYVVRKEVSNNTVFIAHRLRMTMVERDKFEVSDFRFLFFQPYIPLAASLTVKIRHGAQRYRCEAEFSDVEKTKLRIRLLEDKERGITPGQFAVLYEGDRCVGSGVIR